ncbi:M42 family metallopeptidase [Jeotgalibacillus haloalkalitolerans]|uniref:M42 family metallopeptidase n=1 Tax=Jeotgalibacillus haloalkalitolerans TaxID=3104292 RepID=A0ABU5KNX6_9BACL|nr:M42 family metallopeptidase [Jeotgalibacillus sp. HH7-29]MDZ5712962.1 M42 family metallopeptidase [Jeotgalibacillus sp. HH7-29]
MKPNTLETMALLKELVSIPSPSGHTSEIITYIKNWFAERNIPSRVTNKGGLIVTLQGEDTHQHRVLTAHVDTLGAMVKTIKPDGRLSMTMIGGFRWNAVEGEYCTVETSEGTKYTGTILLHQASVHTYKDAGSADRSEQNMEVRLDEVVKSKEDAEALGISVGDFISFDPRPEITPSGFFKSRHIDDKASVAMLMKTVEQLAGDGLTLPFTTHFIIANNEEIGFGGNSNIPFETVEYIAVDMGALGDGQSSDEYTVSICAKDSSGPYHYGLRKHLVQLAKENQIDYKVDIYNYYGSDASAAVRAGADIRHGLIGAGVDASHANERTHEKSLYHTESLILTYLQSPLSED